MLDKTAMRLVFVLEPELKSQFVELAQRNERTVSQELRRLVKQAVARETGDRQSLEGANDAKRNEG